MTNTNLNLTEIFDVRGPVKITSMNSVYVKIEFTGHWCVPMTFSGVFAPPSEVDHDCWEVIEASYTNTETGETFNLDFEYGNFDDCTVMGTLCNHIRSKNEILVKFL